MRSLVGSSRATLRDVARAAGVSQMTVSRALGNRGRVAEETRQRVRELADSLGYRPDPEVAKLMAHLRNRRAGRFQSVMVGLTTRSATDREPYFRALVSGARAQAARRGYVLEVTHLPTKPSARAGLQRVLRSRGVEGLLLLPQQAPIDLTPLLDWRQFSVIAASASPTGPAVHRVMPHHFANTLLLCRKLHAAGYRRLGLIIPAEQDVRSDHGFTAAVTWHARFQGAHPVPPLVTAVDRAADVRAWFRRERPDAIITHEIDAARACARVLGHRLNGLVRYVVTSTFGPDCGDLAGIDERPAAIGEAAAELLCSLIERRARGPPETPATTLLTGRWVE